MADGIYASLAAAQAEMKNPPLDGTNPHFRSRFATLAAVLDSVRGPLNDQGLFLNQSLEDGRLLTTVWNQAGESATLCSIPCKTDDDPQKSGSRITYLRRYSLLSAFGLVGDDDDDGNAASEPQRKDRREPPETGQFTARCRSCGQAYSFADRASYEGFLAGPDARCCQSPDWRVQ